MADTKTTGLSALTALSGDELLYIVEDDDGTPVSRKITIEDFLTGAAGRTELTTPLRTVTCIADTVLGSSAASITFSSVPGTYRSLMLDVVSRASTAGAKALNLQFNGDTGSNYDYWFGGSGTSGADAQTAARAGSTSGSDATAGNAGVFRIVIPDYAGTTFRKFGSAIGGRADADASGLFGENNSFKWRSTSAITSILLAPSSGDFITGTRATLWGVTGA